MKALLAIGLLTLTTLLLLAGVRITIFIYGVSSVIGGVVLTYLDYTWNQK